MIEDEPYGTFAKRLVRLMEERHMTQVELGRRIESPSTNKVVGHWVHARSEPTYASLKRLKAALGCTWEELMEG